MNIQVTAQAKQKLIEALGDQPGYFKLFYDTVDCGCHGITVLLIMSQPDIGDVDLEASSLPFLINAQQEIFYEDQMSLDVDPNFPSFKLFSNSTIYSSNVKTRDIR